MMKSFLLTRANQWWADLPLRWKGATVLLIPVTALICGFASVYLVGVKETNAEIWVFRTSAVRYDIRVVLNAVVDAETAARGFVISRDPQFLDLYYSSLQVFPRSIRDLTKLVLDDSVETKRLIEIKELAAARFNLLSRVVDAVHSNDDAQISRRVSDLIGRERQMMDKLRPKLIAMDEEETRLQELRNRELQADRRLSDNVICLSAIFGILCGVAGMILFSHGIVHQIKRIQKNAERLAKESPLEPGPNRRDEIGQLGRRLLETSNLLQSKQEALREKTAALAAAKEEAERASQVKSDFLSRMSHELRTPLHVILGFGHLLHRKTKPNGEHEYLTQILTAGDHLLALINQVLELSYLRSNNLISSTEPTRSCEPAVKEPMPSSTATGQ